MSTQYNIRAIAANVLFQVLEKGQSLSSALPMAQHKTKDKDNALLQEICFGCLRTLPVLNECVKHLIKKPLKNKQRLLLYLLLVGIYQLLYSRIPAYASINDTVNGVSTLGFPQFKGLINAILRSFQRQQSSIMEKVITTDAQWMHPAWLLAKIQQAYPQQWQVIIDANNHKPPMWLRVNRKFVTREKYLDLLQAIGLSAIVSEDSEDAINLLTPCTAELLPHFLQGWITIQDIAAQDCVTLLEPQNNEMILDLCAAPGGKTTHILELAPQAHVTAVDIDPARIQRIVDNAKRLQVKPEIIIGNGSKPEDWIQNRIFDRILIDAPCSASGVIRRHPDIKWLRRATDIASLVTLQKKMLEAIWPYLKPGGILLYSTCSILPQENTLQIKQFLAKHNNATLGELGDHNHPGWQRLPTKNGGDGFFYAKIIKKL